MPYQRENSKFWQLKVRLPGGKVIRKTSRYQVDRKGGPNYKKALLEEQQLKQQANDIMSDNWAGLTFDQLAELWLDANERQAPKYKLSLKHLFPVFTGKRMADIRRADILAYRQQREHSGAAVSSVNLELRHFQRLINWHREVYESELKNPIKGCFKPDDNFREVYLTHDQYHALLKAAAAGRAAYYLPNLITLAVYTGCRKEELLSLKWADIDLPRRQLHLYPAGTKEKKRTALALAEEAYQALIRQARWKAEHYPDAEYVFTCIETGTRLKSIDTPYIHARQVAGLNHVRFHDLRHTFGSWLVQNGVDIFVVSKLMRHSDVKVTQQRYAHLAPKNLSDAIDALPVFSTQNGTQYR